MLDRSQVEVIGDPPSNRFFSTYTDICDLLTRIDDFPNSIREISNYYTPGEEQLITKLKAKIDEFNRSPHSHATSGQAQSKKLKEIKAVKDLENSTEIDLRYAKISKVLNDNARSPIPLVRNSVAGWIGKFQRGWGMHIVVNQPRINMQWNNISLDINPTVFSESDLFIMSVIVHEFHHVLTERAGPVYEDEFVAHWKQYLVGRVPPFDNVGRAKRINDFLIRDLRGYRYNVPQNKELAKPEDANKNIWNPTTIDNKG